MRKIFFIALMLYCGNLFSQADTVWSYVAGDGQWDQWKRLTQDTAGNIWCLGTTWSDVNLGSQIWVMKMDSTLLCEKGFDIGDEGAQSGEDIWIDSLQRIWILASSSGPLNNGYDPMLYVLNSEGDILSQTYFNQDGWQKGESFNVHENKCLIVGNAWNSALLQDGMGWMYDLQTQEKVYIHWPINGTEVHCPKVQWDDTADAWMVLMNYWSVDSVPHTAVYWINTDGVTVSSIQNDALCSGIEMWDAVEHNGEWIMAGGALENGVLRGHLMRVQFPNVIATAAAFPSTPTESILHSIELKGEGDGYVVAGWTYYFGAGQADAYIHALDYNFTWLGGGFLGGPLQDQVQDVLAFSRNTLLMVGNNASQSLNQQAQGWILKFDDDYLNNSSIPMITGDLSCNDVGIMERVDESITVFWNGRELMASKNIHTLRIWNMQGQLLTIAQPRSNHYPLAFPEGMYMVEVVDQEGHSFVSRIFCD